MTPPAPTPDELDRILALAKAATPGPWHWWERRQYVIAAGPVERCVAECPAGGGRMIGEKNPEQARADAAYLAALSPDVVERLVAAARRAAEQLTDLRLIRDRYTLGTVQHRTIDRAMKELERAP